MDEFQIKKLLPRRPENSHKGTFGQVLNIAGSCYYSGAAYFSSIAPLKVGCGRSTLASIKPVIKSVAALSPDIILKPLTQTYKGTINPWSIKKILPILKNYDAISIGCGLTVNRDTENFFKKLMQELANKFIPVVIDADGLNILAKKKIVDLPKNTVLTPHPIELARLLEISVEEVLSDVEFYAKKCSKKYDCVTVLKTHKTVVCNKDGEKYINNTGNSALAHGGSGDILCGIITGFLAQGLDAYNASILAVYLHGKAAELASAELTEYSTLASDLLNYIPKAIINL